MALTDVLKKVYPFLTAAASFVPGGNIATTALGTILNLKPGATLDDAGMALMTATPEQRASLQAEDDRHKEVMAQMGFTSAADFEKIAADDRASARDREKVVRDYTPEIGFYIMVTIFGTALGVLSHYQIPPDNKALVFSAMGTLGTLLVGASNYFYGTTRGSENKTALLAKAPPISK